MPDEWMGRELLVCLEVLLRGSRSSRDSLVNAASLGSWSRVFLSFTVSLRSPFLYACHKILYRIGYGSAQKSDLSGSLF
jgi:hypothetical protein